MVKCTRCGKENPAAIHTCSLPKALALADMIEEDPMTTWGYREASHDAAAELRRLHAENEALRAALRQHIRTYQVDDQHWAPEEEADRLLAMALARAGEKT
jgi:hypothetical protein